MKYTREFGFFPYYEYNYDRRWYEYKHSVFPFNSIAKFLNDKGWEIESFRYEKTNVEELYDLYVVCSKNYIGKLEFKEEETYQYHMTKNDSLAYYDNNFEEKEVEVIKWL